MGNGVDSYVSRIGRTIILRGGVESITSCGSTDGSNVRNQVVFEYNDLGMPLTEYQEHAGTKTSAMLNVQYGYETAASGGAFTKGLRPTSVTYPNNRVLNFDYSASTDDDTLGRVSNLYDGNATGTLLRSTVLGPRDSRPPRFQQDRHQRPDAQLQSGVRRGKRS